MEVRLDRKPEMDDDSREEEMSEDELSVLDENESEEELDEDDLPDLLDVDNNGCPLRIETFPTTEVDVPDYPIDDEASLLRHFITDNQGLFGVKYENCIDRKVAELMKLPRVKKWKSKKDVKSFLFGWDSLKWRRMSSERESRNYANMLVTKGLFDMNEKMKEIGYRGSLLSLHGKSLFADVKLSAEQLERLKFLPKLI